MREVELQSKLLTTFVHNGRLSPTKFEFPKKERFSNSLQHFRTLPGFEDKCGAEEFLKLIGC